MITVFVSGTGTEVGKTWWMVATIDALRAGAIAAAARKPAQSGVEPGRSDADLLAAATGEAPEDVCPPARWYRDAVAPPMATTEPFTITDLRREMRAPAPGTAVLLVEGAGGPRSPLAADGDNVEFARALAPDFVVLVAHAGLGTLNAVRLAAAPFTGTPLVVALNRFRSAVPLHRENRRWLVDTYGFDVVTTPLDLVRHLLG